MEKEQLLKKIREDLKNHPFVQALFEDHEVPIAQIDDIPFKLVDDGPYGFTDGDNKSVEISAKLFEDEDYKDELHVFIHELVHWLRNHQEKQFDYFDRPQEQDAWRVQIAYLLDEGHDKEEILAKLLPSFNKENIEEARERLSAWIEELQSGAVAADVKNFSKLLFAQETGVYKGKCPDGTWRAFSISDLVQNDHKIDCDGKKVRPKKTKPISLMEYKKRKKKKQKKKKRKTAAAAVTIEISADEQKILDMVKQASLALDKKMYAVGGWVRDKLLGEENRDMDFLCEKGSQEVVKWLQEENLDIYNPDHAERLKRKLNSSEYMYLRTSELVI